MRLNRGGGGGCRVCCQINWAKWIPAWVTPAAASSHIPSFTHCVLGDAKAFEGEIEAARKELDLPAVDYEATLAAKMRIARKIFDNLADGLKVGGVWVGGGAGAGRVGGGLGLIEARSAGLRLSKLACLTRHQANPFPQPSFLFAGR